MTEESFRITINFKMNLKREFDKLNFWDHYLINDSCLNSFNHVFDIGAHIGIFSTIARVRFPKARIYCYEPIVLNYNELINNSKFFNNMFFYNAGLGNNKKYQQINFDCRNSDFCLQESESGNISTISLDNMYLQNQVDPEDNVFLKIDCEGSEKILLSNEYNKYIECCKQLSMEIHFESPRQRVNNFFAKFEDFNDWINQFDKSHNIHYHVSSKRDGYGHFILKRKK